MLRAVYDRSATSGQFCFEERMGCGFGACMGCSCETKYGSKRICKDGPVLVKGGDPMVDLQCETRAGWRLDNPVVPACGTFGFGKRIQRSFMISTCLGRLSRLRGRPWSTALRQSDAAHRGVHRPA